MEALVSLIKDKDIDLLMLQEVREEAVVLKLKEACAFSHYYWKEYFDCKEGLAILSRDPLTNLWTNWDENEDVHNSGSMAVIIETEELKIALMNVHLDYKFAHNREIELEKALNHLKTQEADYKIIAGDFNTYPRSNLYRFLTGLDTMKGKSTRWIDLAEAYCLRQGKSTDITIDFINNPRWQDDPCLEKPGRFDWIMLENPYPKPYPRVVDYQIIGKDIIEGITPSDHYGVVVEVVFK